MAGGERHERVGIVVAAEGDRPAQAALRATVQSLLDQTSDAFDLVVAHRGAIDLEVSDSRIRTVAVESPGLVALLEAGNAALTTGWVRFLSVGDILAPGCLAEARGVLDAQRDVAVVLSSVERVDEGGARIEDVVSPAPGRYEAGALLPELVTTNPWPLGAAQLRRDVLAEVGGFDRSLTARVGHELWLRLVGGHAVAIAGGPGLRAELRDPAPADGPEHARILLRGLRGQALDATVHALGGGARDSAAQGIARAELARRVLRVGRDELLPLVHRLVREARGAGAYFPADEAFQPLAERAPELARPEGWFVPLLASPPRPVAPARGASFPPLMCVAVATDDLDSCADARRAAAAATELAALGIRLLVVHAGHGLEPAPDVPVAVEILRHEGSEDEVEAVLARHGVSLVVSAPGHPVARVASEGGIPVHAAWPDGDLDGVARSLIREAASGAGAYRRERVRARRRAEGVERSGVAGAAVLRTLVGSLGEAAAAVSRTSDHDLLDRLAAARAESDGARRRAHDLDRLAGRALDKLRIGRRLRETVGGGGASPVTTAPVVSLEAGRAERFLEATAAGAGRVWVVYTTDPYSETQGQRSTWITRELLARGDRVVFFYWRWELSESIPPSPHERLLQVPIDQFFRLQRPLMDLEGPGIEKIFLIEFPDGYLFEQIDFANAHGFTTVYDCVDDWEEFARAGQAHWYDAAVERHLVRNADVVVATHPVLASRLEGMGRPAGSIPVVPNGVALDALADAPARARTGQQVIGYFGHLTPAWFDWDLIRDTARTHPEWRFDIIGHGAPEALDLPENVSVPGPVPHEALEERTRGWHVGIVPFRPGRLTQAVDPIKLYEYLALGLPSVVVDMPHLVGVPGVEVCDREGFAAALARSLEATLDGGAVAAFVDSSRWAVRTDVLCDVVARAGRTDLLKAL